MASKYTLAAAMNLRSALHPIEVHALEYLIAGVSAQPDSFPKHDFFDLPESRLPLAEAYSDLCESEFEFALTAPSGEAYVFPPGHSLAIRAPYLRLEDTAHYFELLRWLATLALNDGFVGTLSCADSSTDSPTLLFFFNHELYLAHYAGTPSPYRTQVASAAPRIGD